MLCQNCNKRQANVKYTQIVNNKKLEVYLCEACANADSQFNFELGISDLISHFIGMNTSSNQFINSMPQEMACKKCGMSFADFQKTGKLGCENCYTTYKVKLDSVIKRLHGSSNYLGKIPSVAKENLQTSKEINDLRVLLDQAIKSEEFEQAAEIRDRIKMLESKTK